MVDILLTHCNHLFFDPKQVRKMQPYPPLQTLLAAAFLRQEGFDVALFDSTLSPPEEGFRSAMARHRPRLVALCEDNFNFLSKMCLARNRELAFSMCRAAKEAGIPTLANSSDASDHVAEYLDRDLDFVLVGELEITLLEITRHLLGRYSRPMEEIPGLAYRHPRGREIRCNARRQPMTNLDRLPLPAWDLVEISKYRDAWVRAHGYFSLNMVSSRGCPYRCNWCAKPIYGQTSQFQTPERVAEEMGYLKSTLRPDHLWFADDIFALSPRWTSRFAEEVEKRQAQIPFKMQSRCDLMTRDTAGALRRAGCTEIWMGAESGSQTILDAMEKGIRVEQIYEACENLRRHGIRACLFLQFGYPGETWQDIKNTIRLVRETRPDDIGVSVSYPLPGTKFFDFVSAQLGAKRNWADSDDLTIMFRGSYSSDFYRVLRNALHLEVNLRNRRCQTGDNLQRLRYLWSRVRKLEKTCVNLNPTPLWTCC